MKTIYCAPLLAGLAAASASFAQSGGSAPAKAPPVIRPAPPPLMVPTPAPPAPPPVRDIHQVRPAFVPLVAAPLDTSQASDPIWFAGERPSKNVIARLTLRPVESVVVEQDVGQGAGKKLVLVRAVTGDPTRFRTTAQLGSAAQRIFCADGDALKETGRIPCFEDRTGDGAFESRLYGIGETGSKAAQLSILAAALPLPLPAPIRYRPAAAGEVPETKTVLVNCARDHDQPRFSFDVEGAAAGSNLNSLLEALTTPSSDPAMQRQRMNELSYLTARGACTASQRVREGEPLHPGSVPKGSAVARLGELVIAIGSKEEGAPVRLLGLREPERLYRLTYGTVLAASDAPTAKQKALALQQKFDKPVLMAAGPAEVAEGRRSAGDVIATVPFRHGYMGVLTQDTVIRTLFSKRSLPKGTVLYGVPMSTRTVTSYGGMPLPTISGGVPDPEQVGLVWCVPVQDEAEWSATCLPHQGAAGRYTLLKGQRPAFEVTSMRYSAGMSTNSGDVPVEVQEGDFGKPLSYRFKLKSITPTQLLLTQETMFGDSVVNSKDVSILRMPGRTSGLSMAGGMIIFDEIEGSADAVTVKLNRPLEVGEDLRVDAGVVEKRGGPPATPPAAEPEAGPAPAAE